MRRRGTSPRAIAWRNRAAAALAAGCLVTVTAACSPGAPGASGSPPARTPATPPAPATAGDSPHASAAPAAAPPSCPARVLAGMTGAQRVGQLFLVGLAGNTAGPAVAAEVRAYHFGSFLFGSDSTAGVARTRLVTGAVQSLASAAGTANVRFLIAANQEGGEVQQLQGPGFATIPSALAQGTLPPGVLQQQAAGWGAELSAAGVNLDLAPVMDTVPPGTAAQNAPIGALQREFADTPATVAAHGVAFLEGLRRANVAAAVKHFPGLGRVRGNTDFTSDVVDTVTTADDLYLQPYQAAVDAGVRVVMVALATYTRIDPSHLAVFSTRVINGMLRGRLRFQGVVMSDDLGEAAAVAAIPPSARAIGFLSAGGDLITSQAPGPAEAMATAVLARADTDAAFRAVVNAAALHVLTAKQASGLLPCGQPVTGAEHGR